MAQTHLKKVHNLWLSLEKDEIERLFRRLKGFHRKFSHFYKLDCILQFFIYY